MSLVSAIKNLVFWESDKDFFDKEATIKEYFAVCPPERRRHVESYDELYAEALKYVSKQSFDENTKNIENYFYEMQKADGGVAVLIGVFAYIIACQIDKNGKNIEKKIDDILPKDFDKNNPFDTRLGGKHRNHGHDIFGFGLKNIPSDYPIYVGKSGKSNIFLSVGEIVGKNGNISMLDIIWHYYGKSAKNPLFGIFNCVGHTIVHFAKDLLTSEGVPLPFSSLFSKYKEVGGGDIILDQDDYILENNFNAQVDKVKGNMKASDFAALGFIEGMCKLYGHSKSLGEKEKSFNRDLKILAMGTCIMLQMSSLIIGNDIGKKNMSGAKLNVIMSGALLKNMTQEMAIVVKARHEVNVAYDKQFKEIREEKR